MKTVLVVGATGFIGSAVCQAINHRGHHLLKTSAPRMDPGTGKPLLEPAAAHLREMIKLADSVVNAAGVPESTGSGRDLIAANALLPGLIAAECQKNGKRFIHVSSAAVQGRAWKLDDSLDTSPFSPYSGSKVAGENAALEYPFSVVYRPPGVHNLDRTVTRSIARLAASPLSSVAGRGENNSPQAQLTNVADAIAYLAICDDVPPSIVSHPAERITTAELLRALGKREPIHIPIWIAKLGIRGAFLLGRLAPGLAGHARRIEILWIGQHQAPSWLETQGWKPPVSKDGWLAMGDHFNEM